MYGFKTPKKTQPEVRAIHFNFPQVVVVCFPGVTTYRGCIFTAR